MTQKHRAARFTISRRQFLHVSALATAGAVLAACNAGGPAEAPMEEAPAAADTTAADTTAAGPASQYNEAPMLAEMVANGELPPVDERLPSNPLVIEPWDEIGHYGGTWRRIAVGPGDVGIYPYRLMYPQLIRYNINGTEYIPNLAESWEVSDDATTYTFHLREGTKWSDGEPFTSADLMFWYEDRLGDEDLTPSFPTWLSVGGEPVVMDAPDEFTIRFTFPAPHGLFLTFLAGANGASMTWHPKHYLSQFHRNYVDEAELTTMAQEEDFEFWHQLFSNRATPNLNTDMPVLFAWHYTKITPEVPIVMERNPYYWKVDTAGNQLPYIDKVSSDIVEDSEVLNLRAVAGDIDMQNRHILMENFSLFKENEERGNYEIVLWTYGNTSDAVMSFNLCHPDPVLREIFNDKRFRFAMSYAMNRDEVVEAVYLGQGEPGQPSPLSTSSFYDESQAKNAIEYNPDLANSLLDEMGLTEMDADGIRLRPDGEPLIIIFSYAPVFGAWNSIAELMQKYLAAVGVQLNLKEEARPLWSQRVQASEHDMTVWTGASEFNPLIDPRHFLPFAQGSSHHAACYALWYQSGGANGEEPTGDLRTVIDLYEAIKATADMDEHHRLFQQILDINKENLWTFSMAVSLPSPVIVSKNMGNVPREAIATWHLQTPGNTWPEQYYLRQ